MNRLSIATATRRYLRRVSNDYVSSTVINDYTDQSLKMINRVTEWNRAEATVGIAAGGILHGIATTVQDIYGVRLGTGTDRKRLDPSSRSLLDVEYGDWEASAGGTPTEYFTEGGKIGFYPPPRARADWVSATAYAAGDLVVPSGSDTGFFYECTSAGNSSAAASQPTWPTTIDGTVQDNTVEWQQAGCTWVYLRCLKDVGTLAAGTSMPTWLPRHAHDLVAKRNAIDIGGGIDSDSDNTSGRMQKLYAEYIEEVNRLRKLSRGRSEEYVGRIRAVGYATFRR